MKYLAFLSVPFLLASSVFAATLTGVFDDYSPSTDGDADFDLTALGNVDWAYWNIVDDSSITDPVAGTDSKFAASVIGDMYAVGGSGELRGTDSGSARFDFSFTDGQSGAGSIDDPTGLFNTQLSTAGSGVGLDFVLPDAGVTYEVRVWVAGYNTDGASFTASIAGAADYTDTSFIDDANTSRYSSLYRLTVTPDADSETLSVSFLNNNTAGSAHAIIGGAAVYAVPEPAAGALFIGLAGIGWVALRRRCSAGQR